MSHLDRRRACQKVKVEDSPEDVVLEMLAAGIIDLEILAVGIEKKHGVGTLVATVVVVDVVGAVQVGAGGGAVCIAIPDRADVVRRLQLAITPVR